MKFILTAFFISLMVAPHAYAAPVKLLESQDCPIAKPFTPKPHLQDSPGVHRAIYPMEGYEIARIQITASAPMDLEIIWTPAEALREEMTAPVSVSSKKPQCFFTSAGFPPGFPGHTPAKQVEIRSQKPLKGLTVSFSDVPWDYEGKCSARKVCPTFVKNMDECKAHKGSKACDAFIDNLHLLTSIDQCRRSFDATPVPAIWLCDEIVKSDEVLWYAIDLLKGLKSQKVQEYYKSKEFKAIMDSEYREGFNDL